MKILSKILIAIGVIFGIVGVRSYLRDDAYAQESVVEKASILSAEVTPNPWKNVDGVRLVLTYNRDGVADTLTHTYSEVYSKNDLRITEEKLQAIPFFVRYVPKENRSEKIPDWVIVDSTGEFEGFYGQTSFGQMFTFFLIGIMVRMFGRKKSTLVK
jgi:hypothetical protein